MRVNVISAETCEKGALSQTCQLRASLVKPTNDLDIALSEFRSQSSYSAQLGGADWGKVIRVGKEDGPAVSDPLVKLDGSSEEEGSGDM